MTRSTPAGPEINGSTRPKVALGTPLREITMGGATDGNFTAAIGVPTLDGMGPDGGLSHSEREFLELASIWERMAILFRVIEHLSEKGLG
jgi:glutamate carboxypeptidase